MTQRQFVTAQGNADATDKKLDAFLEGLQGLITNAVADGIKAGLKAQGVTVEGDGSREQHQNQRQVQIGRFRAPSEETGSGLSAFKLPKAEG